MLLTATLAPCAAMAADADIGASGEALLPPPTPLTAAQTLYLDVTLNQAPRGLLPFTELQGRLMASPATLRQLGFQARGDAPVALDQLGGVVVRYDAGLQTLALEVPLEQLSLPTTRLERPLDIAPAAAASPGLLLNYDVYGSH
ncbi:MAG: fimbrial biogenesis outer membrane usher protein, partial [Stenotrophomonas sp.]